MCAQNQTSKAEVARWLILKQAYPYMNSYSLNPTIPLAEKVDADATASFFQRIISPSWLDFVANLQNSGRRINKIESVDIYELNAFLASNKVEPIVLETPASNKDARQQNDISETLPQKRVRMIVEALSGDEGYSDILALPTDAKGKLKDELLKNHPQIFTESTFIKAWSDASASGMIGIAEKKKFTPRK